MCGCVGDERRERDMCIMYACAGMWCGEYVIPERWIDWLVGSWIASDLIIPNKGSPEEGMDMYV